MRSDMAKVIVERPRYGSSASKRKKGYLRGLKRTRLDELPKRESIKSRSGGSKSLNEHLGPLRRYLAKQVGRPWNRVFAEICQHIDRSDPVQDHVRDHVADYVVTDVTLIDGVPCYGSGYFCGQPLQELGRALLYVDPRSGLLRKVQRKRRVHRRSYWGQRPPKRIISQSSETLLIKSTHGWYMVTIKPALPRHDAYGRECRLHDAFLNADLTVGECRNYYGRTVHAVGYRLARKDEIRPYHCDYPFNSIAR